MDDVIILCLGMFALGMIDLIGRTIWFELTYRPPDDLD